MFGNSEGWLGCGETDSLKDWLEGVLREAHCREKSMVCVETGKYSRYLYAFTTER